MALRRPRTPRPDPVGVWGPGSPGPGAVTLVKAALARAGHGPRSRGWLSSYWAHAVQQDLAAWLSAVLPRWVGNKVATDIMSGKEKEREREGSDDEASGTKEL
ncbi:hypothetical protein F4780DRAFT_761072 [Xylariomycetidae sp. FL0641]|nr:hypothetical protein F4780DRAFT_761072 [Xylariomycetidae sp. FL0641]